MSLFYLSPSGMRKSFVKVLHIKNAGFPFRKILQIRKAFYEIIQFGKLPFCTSITVRYPVPMPTQSIDPPDLP